MCQFSRVKSEVSFDVFYTTLLAPGECLLTWTVFQGDGKVDSLKNDRLMDDGESKLGTVEDMHNF